MSHLRRAARVDANQPEIVKALRQIGASVYIVGKPVDLLVGFRGANYLMEVKDGGKAKAQRKTTPAQDRFIAEWTGQVAIVESVRDAFWAIGIEARL